jgi:hypothetical protein
MPLEFTWPMTTSFAGVPSLQANGSSGLTGDASPSGVAGRLEIVPDPTGVRGNVMMSRLFETDAITASYLRSEIANDSSEFSEYWYSWKMMLGDDWGNFSEPFSLMQMHDTPDDGDPVSAPTFILAILSGHIRGIIPDQDLPTEGQPCGAWAASRWSRWFGTTAAYMPTGKVRCGGLPRVLHRRCADLAAVRRRDRV